MTAADTKLYYGCQTQEQPDNERPAEMKLTKTQQQLIDNQRHGRVIVESYHGQGPEGGKVSGGSRRQTAANKLQTFGIIERVDHHSSAVAKNGYTIHVTTNVYKIVNH